MPAIVVALLILLIAAPSFIHFSTEGPGSKHAPIAVALIVGLIVGALAQRSRLCTVGGIRDAMMFKDFKLLYGFIAVIIAVIIGNFITGNFNLGFEGQPVAHTDGLWNALGMALVGWGSVLLGGCPLRQLVLSGEGRSVPQLWSGFFRQRPHPEWYDRCCHRLCCRGDRFLPECC